ncbi:MAG: hypothetical protein L6305_03300, partial [Actinomycetia bacterium]|nr:hypothetical protein [Actinomycetes bacterium]
IKKLILANDEQAYAGKLKRLKFLLTQENYNVFPTSALAIEYYEEARFCWYVDAFVVFLLKIEDPKVIGVDIEDEARLAIKVLVTMFPKISIRMWG